MINLKLKALLLTIICVFGVCVFGFIFYKFHVQTLCAIIGVIILMFIRHTYIAIDCSTTKEK